MKMLHGHRRHRYTPHATSLEYLPRLTIQLRGPRIWIKRDDRTGLAMGGNKARKLEFLIPDALDRGCDTLITCGSVQSNHCRLTAAAAAKEGMGCHLVLREKKPGQYDVDASGNNLLYRLLGATTHVHPPGTNVDAAMEELAESLKRLGRTPYIIPMGGSNAIGSLGYVASALEMLDQAKDHGFRPSSVICASSSGGTQGGLVAGFADSKVAVHGISVDYESIAQIELVWHLVRLASAAMGRDPPDKRRVIVHDEYVGPGYAEPTERMVEAVRLFAQLEGIVLDPVYTGKAAAGLIGLVKNQTLRRGQDVIFVHTGGSPALFAYPKPVIP